MISKCVTKNVSKNISKNISKLTLLLATMAPFSVSHAESVFDRFYLGAGIGESITTARYDSQLSYNFPTLGNSTLTHRSTERLKKDTFFGDIYAGYGFSCCPYYLGGELSLKISDPNATNNSALNLEVGGLATLNSHNPTTLSFNNLEFDLDARPGILLSDCSLLYGRIGAAFTKATLSSNLLSRFIPVGGAPLSADHIASTTKNLVGLRLGGGLEQMIFECMSIRLDYTYTWFKPVNLEGAQSTVFAVNGGLPMTQSLKKNLKFSNHTFMLGLTYFW